MFVKVVKRLLLVFAALISAACILLVVEAVRSVWVCDRFTWSDLDAREHRPVIQNRLLFFNRMRVLLQMTEQAGSRGLRNRWTWRTESSFDPGKHLSFWRRNGICYVVGPLDEPPKVIDRVLTFPLPPLILLIGVPLAVYWRWFFRQRRLRQRKLLGLCLNCGYSLTGNLSGVCPECGERVEAGTVPRG